MVEIDMAESNRTEDMKKERILIPILKKILEKHIPDIEIILTDDIKDQFAGSDIQMKSYSLFKDYEFHIVDAKGATDFIKKEGEEALPTFAMELISTQPGGVRMGWATPYTDEGYYDSTEYFCFYWVFVNDTELDLDENNVSSLEVIIVEKSKVVSFVTSMKNSKLMQKKLNEYSFGTLKKERIEGLYNWMQQTYKTMVKEGKTFHEDAALKVILDDEKVYLNVLNSQNTDKKGPQIIYTSPNRKKEHPLNMTVSKYYLKEMGIFSDKLK